jgi:geranylgeranyl diphosphate synthase type I
MDPFNRYLPTLEEKMRQVVASPDAGPRGLYGMLRYHLGWVDTQFQPTNARAGKRLRPIFLCLCCEAQSGDWRRALPAAVAVELLHNFSLIHDDIEDHDQTRRGRPTLWTIWGIPQAINAGDALFTLAYQALFDLTTTDLPAVLIHQAFKRFNQTTLRLTEGQYLDLSFESQDYVDEEIYLTMVAGKTASLLALCCELGGLIAGAEADQVAALRSFGHNLGMAFQMQDDLLGLWGDPIQTGKPVGSDLIRRKKTLPILHGLAHSQILQALLAKPKLTEKEIHEALTILDSEPTTYDTGSRAYTRERAKAYHDAAMAALTRSQGHGEAQDALYALAENLLRRDR